MELRHPELLALVLPALALTLWAARRSALGLGRARLIATLALRTLLVVALSLVLLDLRLVLPNDERSVVFVVDASESVAPSSRRHVLDWVRRAWEGHRPGDRAGVVLFGEGARIEAPLAPELEVPEPSLEGLRRDGTAIEAGLRQAGAMLRAEPAERRVVLLSDGNADRERAAREAMALASAGIPVTTVAVEVTPSPREVLLGRVNTPSLVSEEEPFLLEVEVVAKSGGPATLHVVRNGRYLAPQEVELAPGSNVVSIPQRLDASDVYVYEVNVSAPGDGDPANNAGGAIVRVRGRPRALIVMGPELGPDGRVLRSPAEQAQPLRQALEAAGFLVTARGPDALPLGSDELSGYAAFVFGNVGAERWTEEQMEAVRRYVFDQGGGLVALGGERSFGQGGYYRTPIEEALPVHSDVRGKKDVPSLALVFCIDRSGSMDSMVAGGASTKLALAKEGAAQTIELLQPFDQAGLVAFDDAAKWLFELKYVDGEPAALKAQIRGPGLTSGGGTALAPALEEALKALEGANAKLKHAILLTDGVSSDSAATLNALAKRYLQREITLTTVGIGDKIDQPVLEDLARRTGGRFHWAKDPSALPRLLTKEAVTASRALIVERPVAARHLGQLAELAIDWEGAPPLLGFVMTAPKDGAEVILDSGPGDGPEDGPLLIRWRYGLGKAVAFTSDASARWSAPWLSWSGYPQLMAGVLRWAARDPEEPGFETRLDLERGHGRVQVNVRAPDGMPVNGLRLVAHVTGPAAAGALPDLELQQTGPGTYQAELTPPRPGAYFATIDLREPAREPRAVASAGAVLAYPREYRHLEHDPGLLRRVAEITGGAALTLDDDPASVFGGPRVGRVDYRSISTALLVAAALVLVLEVAVRRLVLPEGVRRLARRRAAPEVSADGALLSTLRSRVRGERRAVAARREQSQRLERAAVAEEALTRAPAPVAPAAPRAQAAPRVTAPAAPPPPAPTVEGGVPARPAAPRAEAPAEEGEGGSMAKLLRAKRQAREERGGR